MPAAHLTCVAATKPEINAVIEAYRDAGVRHIVALRGDPINGVGAKYAPHPGGYTNAADLVAGIKKIADIEVSVSAYPEKHPDSANVADDIDMLKAKVDAGATRAMTQFFFENDSYFRYLDRVRARGIDIPIVPGILPVQNFKQTRSFAEQCGTNVPRWLAERFDGLDEDVATRKLIAAAVAAEQVLDLVERGVTDFHFYTMNRADLVYAICHLLGLRPARARWCRLLPSPIGRGCPRKARAGEGLWRLMSPSRGSWRRNQTDAERALWFRLRDRRLRGLKFRRQMPIDRYVVDLLLRGRALDHRSPRRRPARRTQQRRCRPNRRARSARLSGSAILEQRRSLQPRRRS